jgi:hypothetical protein
MGWRTLLRCRSPDLGAAAVTHVRPVACAEMALRLHGFEPASPNFS